MSRFPKNNKVLKGNRHNYSIFYHLEQYRCPINIYYINDNPILIVICQVRYHDEEKTQQHPLDPNITKGVPGLEHSFLPFPPLSSSLIPLMSIKMQFEVQAVIYNPYFPKYHIQM